MTGHFNTDVCVLLAQASESVAHGSVFDAFLHWAKVENGWQLALVGFGLMAQAVFFGRWLVQWIASERKRESHMPDMFWWLSLVGASLLLVYFILRGEPVGAIGQSVGWIVYSRNLYLIKVKHRRLVDDVPAEQPATGPAGT